ncbi:hypothetical protein Trydic_g12252 [Trypoxylus dichotomus]
MGGCQPLYCVCGCRFPQRVVAILLCALGAIVAYGQRADMSVAITRLVSHRIRNLSHGCPINMTEEIPIEGGTTEWTELIQGFILGSFYVGYLIGQIPAGIIADIWGPRWVFAAGISCSSVATLLTPPIIAFTHWTAVVASRIVVGIFQSSVFPCISIIISRWVPFEERSTLGAFTYSSVSLGIILGNILSGVIMHYMNNWPNVFYFWGVVGALWTIVFLTYVYSDFQTHPHVPEREKKYLTQRIIRITRLKLPWKKILKDKGIIALIVGQVGHDMTIFLCLTNIPKYLSDVLRMSVNEVSIVSSIPFFGSWCSGLLAGKICDYIILHKNYSLRWNRGITTLISFAGTNTFLLLMTYAGCQKILAIVSYSLAVIFIGPFCAGHKVNQMDITVNFNGFVMSLINGGGCATGFITPLFISLVAKDNELWQWQIVGWYIFVVGGISGLYYLFLLEVDRAEWDVPEDQFEEWKAQRDARIAATQKKKEEKQVKKTGRLDIKTQKPPNKPQTSEAL